MDDSEISDSQTGESGESVPDPKGVRLLYLHSEPDRLAAVRERGTPGLEVIGVSTADDALATLEAQSIDYLMMDPDGPDDWECVTADADCPVLLYTGQESPDAGYEGVIRDITEHNRRERDMADYRSLVESVGDPMYVVDQDGEIRMVNEAMAEFVGQSRAELVGVPVSDLLPNRAVEEGEIALEIARERDEREYETFETWLTDSAGRERLVEATVGPARDTSGRDSGAVVTLRDVTERHAREQELDLIKQIFSRSLRHNIRNKASVIESFATLLAEDLTGEHAEMAQAILRASNSLAKTSEKVSDFDWIVDGDSEIVDHDLATTLHEAANTVRDTNRSAAIEFDVDDGVTVEGIRDLQYAFENLIENALEHGVTGGPPTVTIRTEVREDDVCVVVADDGPGIPEGEIKVIEEGQETELEHGSGLGLWLVDQVVQQSGGDLEFHIDDGTEAHIILPRADVDTAERSEVDEREYPDAGNGGQMGRNSQNDTGGQ